MLILTFTKLQTDIMGKNKTSLVSNFCCLSQTVSRLNSAFANCFHARCSNLMHFIINLKTRCSANAGTIGR